MHNQKYHFLFISDFNIDNFSAYLNNDSEEPVIYAKTVPFGQVMQILMHDDSNHWQEQYDGVIVWTLPERIIRSFNRILGYEHTPIEEILKEVDEYTDALLNIRQKARWIFVPSWILPSYHRGFGMLDMRSDIGIANTLMRMNLRLSEGLKAAPNIYLLNIQKWIERIGKNAFNPKLWYMAKIPFSNEVFLEAMVDIKAALRALTDNSKKLIILDLDDTLWGGMVGEVGSNNIHLGGHDHLGEAYVDFQRLLKSFTKRGILLGIVSKNDESVALEAIKSHPEMVLRLEDFAGWKINWQDKAQNIIDLVSELNLGLQSVVFIDNSLLERARVREALPEVFVPEWPQDCMLYKSALLGLRCFEATIVTEEDRQRSQMYAIERQRNLLKNKVGSFEEWLKSLGIRMQIEEVSAANLTRVSQLLNKTNQMNLSTRRMSDQELLDWAYKRNHKLWVFRVTDKFGDYGLTGIVSLAIEEDKGRIVDFVLSCRVIGRKVEGAMLSIAIMYAREIGLKEIYAEYIPTTKNKPCLDFFQKSGFDYHDDGYMFCWATIKNYPFPEAIQIGGRSSHERQKQAT